MSRSFLALTLEDEAEKVMVSADSRFAAVEPEPGR